MDGERYITRELNDKGRLALLDSVIRMLKQEDDPRTSDAIAHYQAQRETLVRRIQASNPPPVIVQMEVGHMGARGG